MKTNITYFAVVALGDRGSCTAYTLDAYPQERLTYLAEWRRSGVRVKVLGEFASQKQANRAMLNWAEKSGKRIIAK